MKKKIYIVSTYNTYESITTKKTYFLWFLKLQYMRKGYRVWDYPIWLAKLVYKYTGKPILRGRSAVFDKYVPGSDQITYWQPWMNF